VAALGAGAFLFDVTLRFRLPADADYAEAAAALRVHAGARDAVQVWPAWAERARMFVRSMPVRAEEDLRTADFPGVERLWLLTLPRVPFAHLERARNALRARGAVAGDTTRYGALSVEPWELRGPRVLAFLTNPSEEHEVDYVARQCAQMRIGPVASPTRFVARGSGAMLHVRAGVIGERAYQRDRGAVRIAVELDGNSFAELVVPPTVPPQSGWRRLDAPLPAGEHVFTFLVSASDTDRPFCLEAWTTAP
jgi:hypothetical protein